MTKKDYIKIAECINFTRDNVRHDPDPTTATRTVYALAMNMASVLKADNPKFDYAIFKKACGFGQDRIY